jgi:predicted secreted protein
VSALECGFEDRSAERKPPVRAVLLACLFALAAPASALAGDAAELNMLGFSADGGIFAFEEYGVQDGSGFPYASRYYIDTAKDAFIPGSPIRIRPQSEDPSLESVRAEARKKGEAIVSDAELAKHPGYTAAINPISELSADPFRVVANSSPLYPQPSDPMEFRLEELEGIKASATCEDWQEVRGFRLTEVDARAGGTTRIVHEDKQIPSSRGCALGYRIGAVKSYLPDGGLHIAVVILAVRSFGFEGPDYRWLAVSTTVGD